MCPYVRVFLMPTFVLISLSLYSLQEEIQIHLNSNGCVIVLVERSLLPSP